jgi:two-component sensor histidine kinase
MFVMRISDNGIGLPPGLDIGTTRTLGLKLVNFLAKHQMRATVDVKSEHGAEFTFRFEE